jgi:hypothetical protein
MLFGRFSISSNSLGCEVTADIAKEVARAVKPRHDLVPAEKRGSAGAQMNPKARHPYPLPLRIERHDANPHGATSLPSAVLRAQQTPNWPWTLHPVFLDREKPDWKSRIRIPWERSRTTDQLQPIVESACFTAWRIALRSATSSTVGRPVAH